VTESTVNAAAVDTMSDDNAVVLIAATTRVTNTAGAQQQPRSWRVAVSLTREGGQIKLAKVEFVP
jgi:Mce-associated membrane protein